MELSGLQRLPSRKFILFNLRHQDCVSVRDLTVAKNCCSLILGDMHSLEAFRCCKGASSSSVRIWPWPKEVSESAINVDGISVCHETARLHRWISDKIKMCQRKAHSDNKRAPTRQTISSLTMSKLTIWNNFKTIERHTPGCRRICWTALRHVFIKHTKTCNMQSCKYVLMDVPRVNFPQINERNSWVWNNDAYKSRTHVFYTQQESIRYTGA